MTIHAFIFCVVYGRYVARLIDYNLTIQLKNIGEVLLQPIGVTFISYLIIYFIQFKGDYPGFMLALNIITYTITFLLLNVLLKNENFMEIWKVSMNFLNKKTLEAKH